MSDEKTEISNDVDAEDIGTGTPDGSSGENIDETTETGEEAYSSKDEEEMPDPEKDSSEQQDVQVEAAAEKNDSSKKKAPLFRAPLIVAACIFLCTLIGFGVWKCFFDSSIDGDWVVEVNSDDGEKMFSYVFSFDNENHFSMSSGGTSLSGNYYLDDRKNSDGTESPIFSIYLTNLGSSYINADFGYSFEGNAFTGRVLKLTDYTGLFFPPDDADADEETSKKKQAITDSVRIDDVTYYIWDFKSTELKDKIDLYSDFSKKDEVLGSWIFIEENSGFAYTLTFYDDGRFEQLSKESRLVGAYKIEDGTCTLGYYNLGGEKVDAPVSFAVDGDTLTFNGLEYKKTADKNDYKSATK